MMSSYPWQTVGHPQHIDAPKRAPVDVRAGRALLRFFCSPRRLVWLALSFFAVCAVLDLTGLSSSGHLTLYGLGGFVVGIIPGLFLAMAAR